MFGREVDIDGIAHEAWNPGSNEARYTPVQPLEFRQVWARREQLDLKCTSRVGLRRACECAWATADEKLSSAKRVGGMAGDGSLEERVARGAEVIDYDGVSATPDHQC